MLRPAALIFSLILFLSASVSSAAPFTTIVTPNQLGEPDLVSSLDTIYGPGGYVRITDAVDTLWTIQGTTFSVKAVSSFASSLVSFGLCIVCDGSDDITYTPSIDPNTKSILDLPLAANSNIADGIYSLFTDSTLADPNYAGSVGRVFSSPLLNPLGADHMVTFQVVGKPNTYIVAFEDWFETSNVASDRDFNDVALEITAYPIPEPGSMALLGGGLIAAFGLLRRRSKTA
ncbi:MAG: DUF4114 domain-containing protein [Acidobacteria bacterium]|nr:DUF4114 domain-containing protein [Acidobacteriota bacterium]